MNPDEELSARYPDTRLDHENKYFYQGLLRRQLLLSRCAECGRWEASPRALCPQCWRWTMRPTSVTGSGTIALITYLHQGPAAAGVDYDSPYPLVAVDLADQPGVRFSSTLAPARTDAVIGDVVELVWIERAGRPLPAFRLLRERAE
jgi:uncharacterized OB-fold protein